MAVLRGPARCRPGLLATALASWVGLIVLAARADSRAVGASLAFTALDLAVGLAFVLAALLATGAARERLLFGAVGHAWLAGSVFESARSLHQGLLAVALLAFPTGQVRGAVRQLLAVSATIVIFEVVPQMGVALIFGAVAVLALREPGSTRAPAIYPVAAGVAMGAALAFSWWSLRHSSTASPFWFYAATLMTVAIAFPFATRAAVRSGALLADRVLGDARFAGLSGLRLVLADLLNDDGLQIYMWDPATRGFVDSAVTSCPVVRVPAGLAVLDGDELLARVVTTSPAVADGPTAEAVAEAVRLAVVNHRLSDEHTQRLADLEASRRRLLAATDCERERVAARLRIGAGASLRDAHRALAAADRSSDPESSDLIEFALSEVAAAATDVQQIVAGAPPEMLGNGRLRGAMAALANRCPLRVHQQVDGDVAASTEVETALFYVCSEALTNASKHARASSVTVELRGSGEQVLLTVRDDGSGGADPEGSGLQGLADRMAAVGGRLTVTSSPGAGTTIVASVKQREG